MTTENRPSPLDSDSKMHAALQIERASRLYELLDDALSALDETVTAMTEVARDDLDVEASMPSGEFEDLRACVGAARLATNNAIRIALPHLTRARDAAGHTAAATVARTEGL